MKYCYYGAILIIMVLLAIAPFVLDCLDIFVVMKVKWSVWLLWLQLYCYKLYTYDLYERVYGMCPQFMMPIGTTMYLWQTSKISNFQGKH